MSRIAGVVYGGEFPYEKEVTEGALMKMFSAMQGKNLPPEKSLSYTVAPDGEYGFAAPGKKETFACFYDRYHVVMDGYILNGKELQKELEEKGGFSGAGSTNELIASLYRQYGKECWKKLDGSFVIALYDRKEKKLFLVRDPVGSRGLFFFCTASGLAFAGSPGVLQEHEAFPEVLEEQALWDFLSLQYVPEGTIYRNVRKLLPGSFAEISFSHRCFCVIRKYWTADFSVKETFSYREGCERLRQILFQSVEKHLCSMPGCGEKGIFLSGGVDSCIIGGICAKLYGGDLKVFSMGSEAVSYDEREQAAINFRHIENLREKKMEYFVELAGSSSLPLLREILDNYGSPYGDSSLLPASLLCALAAEKGCSTAFCGDGADELFGGYERYLAMRYLASTDEILPEFFRNGFASLCLSLLPESGERGLPARAKRFLRSMKMSGKERYFSMISHVSEKDKERIAGEGILKEKCISTLENFDPRYHLEHGTSPDKREWPSEFDFAHYLADDCLVKMELASEHSLLDVRAPFLQKDVVEFALKLPYSFKEKDGFRKRILCDAFADLMPPGLARRKKRGFGVPVAAFFRGEWKEIVEKELLEGFLVKKGCFNNSGIREILQEHCRNKKDHSYLLFSLLMAEFALRKFLS